MDTELERLLVSRQCELASVPRSTYSYQRQEAETEDAQVLAENILAI